LGTQPPHMSPTHVAKPGHPDRPANRHHTPPHNHQPPGRLSAARLMS
jgi:hypothetical protein